jgi:hypothetical protein
VLKTEGGIMPSSSVSSELFEKISFINNILFVRSSVVRLMCGYIHLVCPSDHLLFLQTWLKLRHPNILRKFTVSTCTLLPNSNPWGRIPWCKYSG